MAKTIYLIGGTSDANLAASRLEKEGYRVVVSVATEVGALLAGGAVETDAGMKDAEALARRARHFGAAAIVDCSHPFATQVSAEAKRASQLAELHYVRYLRPSFNAEGAGNCIHVQSWAEAVDILKEKGGRSLLTIGTRNLAPFVAAGLNFMVRILPVASSLQECERLGISPRDILAVYPPFSVNFNKECIRLAQAEVLVTKDSGREGGLPEKLEAAASENIDVILVERPEDPGSSAAIHSLEQLLINLAEIGKS